MTEKDIREARKGIRLKDHANGKAQELILALVKDLLDMTGSPVRDVNETTRIMAVTADLLYKQLINGSGMLTVEEMRLACEDAIYNGTGNFKVNASSMYYAIKQYCASDLYKRVLTLEARERESFGDVANSNRRQQMIDFINSRLEALRAGRRDFIVAASQEMYTFLVENGKLAADSYRAYLDRGREMSHHVGGRGESYYCSSDHEQNARHLAVMELLKSKI